MWRLIIYTIASLLNLALWLGIVITTIDHIYVTFLFLTVLSFTLSTFYLAYICIMEILLHIHRHNQSRCESLREYRAYKVIRERIFKFVFTASVTVCISYWLLCKRPASSFKRPEKESTRLQDGK